MGKAIAIFLIALATNLWGVWHGYERGYQLGFRHGVDLTILEIERRIEKRERQ